MIALTRTTVPPTHCCARTHRTRLARGTARRHTLPPHRMQCPSALTSSASEKPGAGRASSRADTNTTLSGVAATLVFCGASMLYRSRVYDAMTCAFGLYGWTRIVLTPQPSRRAAPQQSSCTTRSQKCTATVQNEVMPKFVHSGGYATVHDEEWGYERPYCLAKEQPYCWAPHRASIPYAHQTRLGDICI